MSRILSAFLILAVLLMGVPTAATQAQTPVPGDPEVCAGLLVSIGVPGVYGSQDSGAKYCYWVPPGWNGDFVIYAHGYVDPKIDNGLIPWDQLVITDPTTFTQTSLPGIVAGVMHYGFAVTSYSKNGLAVKEGTDDVIDLAKILRHDFPTIKNIYLVGASEGGLVTALAIEKNPPITTMAAAVDSPRIFSAGVSTCGPVGDFRKQVNYWGDFRVAFDYFFNQYGPTGPYIKGDAITIDQSTIDDWGTYNPLDIVPGSPEFNILAAMAAAPASQTKQLLSVGKAPVDPNVPATVGMTVLGILDYNVKATNEAQIELKGNPFDNRFRWYFGSQNDWELNKWIRNNDTYSATGEALQQIANNYQTSGRLKAPLVTLHTTGDPIVPYWHEPIYLLKVWLTGNGLKLFSIPINRYGHCAFTAQEAIFAFALAVFRATGTIPPLPVTSVADNQTILTQQEFNDMLNLVTNEQPKLYYVPLIQTP